MVLKGDKWDGGGCGERIFMLYLHIHKAEHYFKRLKYFVIHIIFAQPNFYFGPHQNYMLLTGV